MNKNIKYILLFLVCFIGVAIMYIGGLVSDHKRDAEKKQHKESVVSETPIDSKVVSTNSIPSKPDPINNTNVYDNIN